MLTNGALADAGTDGRRLRRADRREPRLRACMFGLLVERPQAPPELVAACRASGPGAAHAADRGAVHGGLAGDGRAAGGGAPAGAHPLDQPRQCARPGRRARATDAARRPAAPHAGLRRCRSRWSTPAGTCSPPRGSRRRTSTGGRSRRRSPARPGRGRRSPTGRSPRVFGVGALDEREAALVCLRSLVDLADAEREALEQTARFLTAGAGPPPRAARDRVALRRRAAGDPLRRRAPRARAAGAAALVRDRPGPAARDAVGRVRRRAAPTVPGLSELLARVLIRRGVPGVVPQGSDDAVAIVGWTEGAAEVAALGEELVEAARPRMARAARGARRGRHRRRPSRAAAQPAGGARGAAGRAAAAARTGGDDVRPRRLAPDADGAARGAHAERLRGRGPRPAARARPRRTAPRSSRRCARSWTSAAATLTARPRCTCTSTRCASGSERIEELTGRDVSATDDRVDFYLALGVEAVRDATAPDRQLDESSTGRRRASLVSCRHADTARRIEVPGPRGARAAVAAGRSACASSTSRADRSATCSRSAPRPTEYLSASHTRAPPADCSPPSARPSSRTAGAPLLALVADDSPGVHDMLIAACDPERYASSACTGRTPRARRTCRRAGRPAPALVPQPVNLFMNIPVGRRRRRVPARVHRPGDSVTLRALADVDVVLSACPQDVLRINGGRAHPAADRAAVIRAADPHPRRLANRIAVAPMSRVRTAGDGVATDAMADYYAEFARGGFGS